MNQRLKQRLIGAVVLVALAVIFVPMFLSGPVPRDGVDVPLAIPPQPQVNPPATTTAPGTAQSEQAPLLTDTQPVDPPRSNEQRTQVDSEPVRAEHVEQEQPPVRSQPTIAAPTPAPSSAPAPTPPAPPVKQAPAELATWTVQVASFSDQSRALTMRDQLRKKGYPAYVESAKAANQQVFRVRVGPMAKRDAAEAMLTKLAKAEKLQGQVRPHP